MFTQDRISGMLVNEQGVSYSVLLDLKIAQLSEQGRLVDEEISQISLTPGSNVPDGGPYTLYYCYHGKEHATTGLQVQYGTLLAGQPV